MAWARVDDEYPRHGKIQGIAAEARADAIALELAALCYSARVLSDGRISRAVTSSLGLEVGFERRGKLDSRRLNRAVSALVSAGRWSDNGPVGYMIHDYAEYQPSASDVKERRKREAEKKRKQRAQGRMSLDLSQGDNDRDAREVSPALSRGDTSHVGATGAGAPTRPGPFPTHRTLGSSAAEDQVDLEPKFDTPPENQEPDQPAAGLSDEPATLEEVAEMVNALPGSDPGSLVQVEPLALQLPASEFFAAVDKLKRRRNVENAVGWLIGELRQVVRRRHAAWVAEQAAGAEQFTTSSAIEKLKRDKPEAYVKAMAGVLENGELADYLERYVQDEDERIRLADLAADLREGAAA